jgi:hypothetical protein
MVPLAKDWRSIPQEASSETNSAKLSILIADIFRVLDVQFEQTASGPKTALVASELNYVKSARPLSRLFACIGLLVRCCHGS